MDNKADQHDIYIMLQIAGWITAVLLQAERVLSLHRKQNEAGFRDPNGRYLSIAEEEFFVVAARRLVRWLGEAKKRQLLGALDMVEVSKFERVIVDVRDMREHADEYIIRNRGRKQSDFHFSAVDGSGSAKYTSDATATIVLDCNYLIGGRLSVQQFVGAVERLRKDLKAQLAQDDRFSWMSV